MHSTRDAGSADLVVGGALLGDFGFPTEQFFEQLDS